MKNYLIITSDGCSWCDKAKDALAAAGHNVTTLNLVDHPDLFVVMNAIGAKTVPQVLQVIGGYEATAQHLQPTGVATG